MGSTVTMEQQGDLGILARAAMRYAMSHQEGVPTVLITSAVARMVPLLAENDIRQMIYDADRALSSNQADRYTWTNLLLALRRVQ